MFRQKMEAIGTQRTPSPLNDKRITMYLITSKWYFEKLRQALTWPDLGTYFLVVVLSDNHFQESVYKSRNSIKKKFFFAETWPENLKYCRLILNSSCFILSVLVLPVLTVGDSCEPHRQHFTRGQFTCDTAKRLPVRVSILTCRVF